MLGRLASCLRGNGWGCKMGLKKRIEKLEDYGMGGVDIVIIILKAFKNLTGFVMEEI